MEHGTQNTYRRHKCRCDACKGANAAYMRAYNARRKERTGVSAHAFANRKRRGRPLGTLKMCAVCREPMEKVMPSGAVPVHLRCRGAYMIAERRKARTLPARRRLPRHWQGITVPSPSRVWVTGPCEWCGEAFTTDRPTARFCSERHRRAASRRRRGKFVVPPPVREAIYARDRWTCQICLGPLDMSAEVGARLSATLDHVVPQILGGTHDPTNLRSAHQICNSYRRDGREPDERIAELVSK